MGALGQVIVHGFTAIILKMSPNRVDIDLENVARA